MFQSSYHQYLTNSKFRDLNAEQAKNGDKIFSNPRNVASGTIRQFKTNVQRNEKLSFFAYSVGQSTNEMPSTQFELLTELGRLGFKTNPLSKFFYDPIELFAYYEKMPIVPIINRISKFYQHTLYTCSTISNFTFGRLGAYIRSE